MLRYAEFVQFERVEDRIYVNMSCRYPHEICVYLKERSIKRLAKMFMALSKGKRKCKWKVRARSKELTFPFVVTAHYNKGNDKPCIFFKYKFYDYSFESVSEAFTRYDDFSKEALERFANELLAFESTNKATLCER